jgi:REP element-mobilizing transposase RayT
MARRNSQLNLSLPARKSWGGRRPGAGRKPGKRPALPHRSRRKFRALPAHVTLRVRSGVPSLRTVPIAHAIERTFAAGCARPGFRLVHYSLQGNHAHLIVEARDRDALGRGMMAVGARLARAVNRIARHSGHVLAERYHVRLLPTPKEVRNALRYVLLNARRHAKAAGRTRSSAVHLDPASSARWFDGWRVRGAERGIAGPSPVARARTWLLAVGWRRHGLIDPADVPGTA